MKKKLYGVQAFVGWVRRIGRFHEKPKNGSRWEAVAQADTEGTCWWLVEEARQKMWGCLYEWTVLPRHLHPRNALVQKRSA